MYLSATHDPYFCCDTKVATVAIILTNGNSCSLSQMWKVLSINYDSIMQLTYAQFSLSLIRNKVLDNDTNKVSLILSGNSRFISGVPFDMLQVRMGR